MTEPKLTHIDEKNRPTMVDVTSKRPTSRMAKASGQILLPPEIYSKFQNGEINSPKGPVFQTAIIAGTAACKKTWDLIPFCHPLPIDAIKINIDLAENGLAQVSAQVKTEAKTGVEMEALTAVGATCLTIYDMCKAISHKMVIGEIKLEQKSGGKRTIGQPE